MGKPKSLPGDPFGVPFKAPSTTHVPFAKVTGTQLDTIRLALEHPKPQPDGALTLLSVLNTVVSFVGILKGVKGTDTASDLVPTFVLLLLNFGIVCAILNEYRRKKTEIDYQQVQALKYVEALMLQTAETQANMEELYAQSLIPAPSSPPQLNAPNSPAPQGPVSPQPNTQPSATGSSQPKTPKTT